jgi:fatty acid desaturase
VNNDRFTFGVAQATPFHLQIAEVAMPADPKTAHEASPVPGSTPATRATDALFTRRTGIAIVVSFLTLAAIAALLSFAGVISGEALSVLLWALLGLYFAFGILIVAYRMIGRLA